MAQLLLLVAPFLVRACGVRTDLETASKNIGNESHVEMEEKSGPGLISLEEAEQRAEVAREQARQREKAAMMKFLQTCAKNGRSVERKERILVEFRSCEGEEAKEETMLGNTIPPDVLDTIAASIGPLEQPEKHMTLGCMVYTYHKNRQRLLDELSTWAVHCDKVYAFSDEKLEIPEIRFSTIVVHPDGGESYNNLWRKTQKMWTLTNKRWLEDGLDFLLVGGDDMFWIVPKTRSLLNQVPEEKVRGEEHFIMGQVQGSFISGAGYVVNRKTAETVGMCVGVEWDRGTSAEDVMASECLKSHGFDPTTDDFAMKNSHRFGAFGVTYDEDAILYHYVTGQLMFRLYNGIYRDANLKLRKRLCAPQQPDQIGNTSEASFASAWEPKVL